MTMLYDESLDKWLTDDEVVDLMIEGDDDGGDAISALRESGVTKLIAVDLEASGNAFMFEFIGRLVEEQRSLA